MVESRHKKLIKQEIIAEQEHEDGSKSVAVEGCYCGSHTFYISKARDIYCSSCHVQIEGVMAFDCATDKCQ